jgi:uncharacterized protein YecE (DUF72 family)
VAAPAAVYDRGMAGRLFVGTSGFSYAAWTPRFYPPETKTRDLLTAYAARLNACELNGTFYRHPTESSIAGWLAATPSSFRFSVKAQRGGSLRAFSGDPATTVSWLTRPYHAFGDRLSAVLFRVPEGVARDDARLDALLAAWPPELPLTLELRDPSWVDDDVHARVREANAVLCATELPDDPAPPTLRATGPFLYLRLRRETYSDDELAEWAARVEPFLADGRDVYVFFRHDPSGESPLRAVRFRELADPG